MASGAGDGLAHTMNAFVQPGDFVITEAPEYPLILDMIEAHGAMAFGVPMDGFGMLPDALDRALTMLESQRLAVPHGGHQVSMILLQPRAQNPTGASFSPATHRRFGGRAARALPEWRWYAADCGRRSQWRCGQWRMRHRWRNDCRNTWCISAVFRSRTGRICAWLRCLGRRMPWRRLSPNDAWDRDG